jgi:hypothetical protein
MQEVPTEVDQKADRVVGEYRPSPGACPADSFGMPKVAGGAGLRLYSLVSRSVTSGWTRFFTHQRER